MTFRHKLAVAGLVASTVAALALLLSPGSKAQAQGQGRGLTLSGTIYGTLGVDPEPPYDMAWVGEAMVSFDNGLPVLAKFVDRNNSADFKKHGLSGTETISLEFTDGSGSFDIKGRFEVSAASTPGLFVLHETGYIANGTGKYQDASGQVSIQGPAVERWSEEEERLVGMWISEIHGVLIGAK